MKKVLLALALFYGFTVIVPESTYAQLFGNKSGRARSRKNNRKIGSFTGSKRLFNPEISYIAFGGGINSLNYFGDLAPNPSALSTDISFTRPGINLMLRQKINERWHWRGNFMWGRISGSDQESADLSTENANRYLRNMSFRNDIFELSITGQVDLFKHSRRYVTRPVFNPYLFFGLGVIYHNPKGQVPEYFSDNYYMDPENLPARHTALENAGEWVSLRELGTEGQNYYDKDGYESTYNKTLKKPYSRFVLVVPVGIGARYKLTNNVDISMELGYRHVFSDYLDDVSGQYVDMAVFVDEDGNFDATAAAFSDMSNQFTREEFENIRQSVYNGRVITNESELIPGLTWQRAAGYGNQAGDSDTAPERNVRGNSNDNDMYFVTNIQVSFILGRGLTGRAKFR